MTAKRLLSTAGTTRSSAPETLESKAKGAASAANLRQLATSMQMFVNDKGHYPAGDLGVDGSGSSGPRGVIWLTELMPYLGSETDWDGPTWNTHCQADASDGRYNNPPSKVFMDPLAQQSSELSQIVSTTRDAIWGYGYNVYPWKGLPASELPPPATNGNTLRTAPWGTWSPYVVQTLRRQSVIGC